MEIDDTKIIPENSGQNLKEIRRITWIGLWTNLGLTGIKLLAGVIGNSTVLIADGIHSFSDLATDVAILVGSRFWGQPADRCHPYGHAKIETLVTLLIGLSLIFVSIGLIYGAVESLVGLLYREEPPAAPTWVPFAAALISIVVKEYLYQITAGLGTRIKSSAVVANAWHHRSDALSSIPAALAVGGCLFFGEQYAFLDPVGTVVVAFMVVYAAWEILQPSFGALIDAGTTQSHYEKIADTIRSFPEVHDKHKLRTRQLGPSGISVDVHIQVDPEMSVRNAHSLCHRIKEKLKEDRRIVEVFIHVEPFDVT